MTTEKKDRKPRTVAPSVYRIEVQPPQQPAEGEHWARPSDDRLGHDFAETADAKKALRDAGIPGEYRIIKVCWTGAVKVESKPTVTLG